MPSEPAKPTAQVIAFARKPAAQPHYPATLKVLTVQAATLLEILRAKSF